MKKYLFDTSTCVFLIRGKLNAAETLEKVGYENCFISEVSIAELRYGAEKSLDPLRSHRNLTIFLKHFTVVPIFYSIQRYAAEKVSLERMGTPLHDEFDLLIAATALENNFVLVTNNTKHFARFKNIILEHWLNT